MTIEPEKKTVVFGCNSWWRLIESESQLKTITDADIDNVWYVRALRALTEHSERPANTD